MQDHLQPTEKKTISITIPKMRLPSMQSAVLILIIVAGLLQTVELYALDQKIASSSLSAPKGAVSAATPAASASGGSSLPEMVGGC